MPIFEATAAVAAPPRTVWTTLLRTSRWPSWDPQLESVSGALDEGGRLELRVRGQSRTFRLAVTGWQPGRGLVLAGGMPLGLFTGTRTYALVPAGPGTTVTIRETYSGPLAGLIGRSVPDLQPFFDAFVQGLRAEAENAAASVPTSSTEEQA